MARNIDSIETSDFLTTDEIKKIRDGYGYMVEPGYGKLAGLREVFRAMAARIENARREIAIGRMWLWDTKDQEFRVRCELAGFQNLVIRSGILDEVGV